MRPERPDYLKIRLGNGPVFSDVLKKVRQHGLNTVCVEAKCPNLGECWGAGTTTVMILGDTCTRNCRFCSVKTGNPRGVTDPEEPKRVAQAIAKLDLKYAVITSVDRDDLDDGGASLYAAVVRAIKTLRPKVTVEVLIPDYQDDRLRMVLDSGVDCLAHNVEVVKRLTPKVRDRRASYEKSLAVLKQARAMAPQVPIKTSLMVGLGETKQELRATFADLAAIGVDILTIGQYLRPTSRQLPVVKYYSYQEFDELKEQALAAGIRYVLSGPLVRSSYKAMEVFQWLHDTSD